MFLITVHICTVQSCSKHVPGTLQYTVRTYVQYMYLDRTVLYVCTMHVCGRCFSGPSPVYGMLTHSRMLSLFGFPRTSADRPPSPTVSSSSSSFSPVVAPCLSFPLLPHFSFIPEEKSRKRDSSLQHTMAVLEEERERERERAVSFSPRLSRCGPFSSTSLYCSHHDRAKRRRRSQLDSSWLQTQTGVARARVGGRTQIYMYGTWWMEEATPIQ